MGRKAHCHLNIDTPSLIILTGRTPTINHAIQHEIIDAMPPIDKDVIGSILKTMTKKMSSIHKIEIAFNAFIVNPLCVCNYYVYIYRLFNSHFVSQR